MIVFYLLLILRVGQCTDQIIETRTVGVGTDVNLSCTRESSGSLFWIRVVSGNFPQFLGKTFSLNSDPHITVTAEPGTFVLRIKKAKTSDTAVYYCMKTSQKNLTFLKATDLRVEEPDITAVPPSDPVRPGDSVIQEKCSVLSDSEIKTCPGEHGVCCVRAGSHQYHPGFNYTQGNSVEEHEENPETFIYSFFMTVTSSDAGSYYCAVATCEEKFSEHRSKLDTEDTMNSQKDNTLLFLLCAALAASLIVIAILIHSIKKLKKKSCGVCDAAVVLKTNVETASGPQQSRQTDEDSLVYSAPIFSGRKARTGRSKDSQTEEEESLYTEVRVQGLK
ncbi:uncharacterized protein [Cebidichthys violaceus]|uniref:uncharacterized protein isoform X2 n=1 Tax=Cebidichthys violaceus TaxID=271503 RepID=UPI0035CBD834